MGAQRQRSVTPNATYQRLQHRVNVQTRPGWVVMKATQGPNDTQVKGFSDVSVTMKPAMNPKINLQQV